MSWWNERQTKGLRGELAETAARGVYESMSAADRLLTEFPEGAAAPILAGADASRDDSERCYFVRLVGKLKDDRAPDFLLREAREGPFLRARVEAAWQLGKLGRTEGLSLMIEEWRHLPPFPGDRERFACDTLIALLAMSDSAEAMRALADGLRRRSPEVRNHIVFALTPGKSSWSEFGEFLHEKTPSARPPATRQVIEELAVSEAEDTAAYFDAGWIKTYRSVFDPRLCDAAVALLAAGWPDRYKFDITASYPVRERARIACLNVWREQHGQPPLPLPHERPPVAPGDELKIAEVAPAGDDRAWPDSVRAVLRAAQGKAIDPGLLVSAEQSFLEAGRGPDRERGFYFFAFRENAIDGITLLAGPMPPRSGPAPPPNRQWRLQLSTMLPEGQGISGQSTTLLGQNPLEDHPKVLPQIFDKIVALPGDKPFSIRMDLTPAP